MEFISLISMKFFLISNFLLGFMSDMVKRFLPVVRLLIQAFDLFGILMYFKLSIIDVRIDMVNDLLNFSFVTYLFTLFCVLVLMNGSNFMDGVNLLSIGYFLMVLTSIFWVSENFQVEINLPLVKNLFLILSFLFSDEFIQQSFFRR